MHLPKSIKLLWILFLLLAACSRKNAGNGTVKDTISPSITIVSPAANQQFSSGQTIQITVNATDNSKVTELHIHVNDKTSGALLRDIHSYPGNQSATVQDIFSAQAGNFIIKVIAYDAAQNLGTAEVEVLVN